MENKAWIKNCKVTAGNYLMMENISRHPIIGIIQARMSSSRLPGKVLVDIGGLPMLSRVVVRSRRSHLLDEVIVATTIDPSDDPVYDFCVQHGFSCFRGSLHDVLDRYFQAAKLFAAQTIVRITADCPVIAPEEIDRTTLAYLENRVDFAANRLPPPFTRTTPIGLDTEVCSMGILEQAWLHAKEKYEREHVMPYIYGTPGRFNTISVDMSPSYAHFRWTVDTPEDLDVIRLIYQAFNNRDDFSLLELISLYEKNPEWHALSATVKHKSYLDIDKR